MDNEMMEQALPEEGVQEQLPEEPAAEDAEEADEVSALRGEVAALRLRLALLTGGAAPGKLEEGMKLAAGILSANGGDSESAAAQVLSEYPHLRLERRSIPQLSAECSGKGDGFAAIRNIFAKR